MKSRDIRESFLKYFEKNGHTRVASSSLIPENDNTLLFANAGMNQFKNSFLGLEQRPYTRATTSQKVVRAGGKHNDLENVGFTARHHTFFEMLGNFSFGDYFKKDAIHYAWELLTQELQIPKEKLSVTVFETDDEAADIWHKQEGVPRDRIYRFGEKDNFWRMGDTGPCGPCSEIFYDHGPDADPPGFQSVMGGDGDRYVEIWNLVFMQYNEDASRKLNPLPKPSVDTGGGLERFAAALQGHKNNFDTDLFQPIIAEASRISKQEYVSDEKILLKNSEQKETTAALRVVADHTRAMCFLLADGVIPANDGRGYVLRRIMRRAIRYARKLTDDASLLEKTAAVVIAEMSMQYPELKNKKSIILTTIKDEVSRFLQTLDQGTEILNSALSKLSARNQKLVDGETVFKLYDTFGFPPDLTRLMAVEKGFQMDEAQFEKLMLESKQKAKASWKGKAISSDAAHTLQLSQKAREQFGATKFLGYEKLHSKEKIAMLSSGQDFVSSLSAGQSGILIFAQTPFYAEGGGQVGDHGVLSADHFEAEVIDVKKQNDIFLHFVQVTQGEAREDLPVDLQVTTPKRRNIMAHHSATHLLHAALRKTLGSHVSQAGSLVGQERLRFDFTHNKALSESEIQTVEDLVNEQIAEAREVESDEMPYKAAIEKGALALFGEKYGDKVRVLKMGDFSTELCGGTHVTNTSQIRLFKIVSESGVSAGVRRIEALAGDTAFQFLLKNAQENMGARRVVGYQESWDKYMEPSSSNILTWIEQSQLRVKELEREIKSLKATKINIDELVKSAQPISGGQFVSALVEVDDRGALSDISDRIRDKLGSAVILLVGKATGANPIVITVSKDLTQKYNAGKLLGEFAKELGGKGGGRPDFAQGACEDLSQIKKAFAKAQQLVGL